MSNLSLCLHAFVTELINGGVKHVIINPGSRNFPLIKTLLAANKFLEIHSCVDERSAGFMALGLAQSTQSPVVLCCTSGTAGLNYYPAIAESFYSETPLLILTADRPPESIDNWEGQCVRQENVFDKHTVASFQTPIETGATDLFGSVSKLAVSKAVNLSGPVHVNLPFREPFYLDWVDQEFKCNPVQTEPSTFDSMPPALSDDILSSKKILWVNGASISKEVHDYPDNLVVFSDTIANKLEGIVHWESILSSRGLNETQLLPDLLITTGKYVVSKQLKLFLSKAKNLTHWHLSNRKKIPTPFHTKPKISNCSADEVLEVIRKNQQSSYKKQFVTLNNKVDESLKNLEWKRFSEFSVINTLYKAIPDDSVLHLSNSMPIRYVGLLPKRDSLTHLANRGTSGIDGCTSTALGFAKGSSKPVFLFTGDLAFLYDINALWQERIPQNIKIVVLNNHGGGIFELIDGPNNHIETLPLQTTNHALNMAHLAAHFKVEYLMAQTNEQLENCLIPFLSLSKPVILEIQTERSLNNNFYNEFKETVNKAIYDDK